MTARRTEPTAWLCASLNALRRAWLRWEADELEMWLHQLRLDYALNGMPADSEHARACRHRLAEIEVRIATLQPHMNTTTNHHGATRQHLESTTT